MARDSNVVDVKTHSPAYANQFAELSTIYTGRVILTCKKLGAYRNPLFEVFEKTVPWNGGWAKEEIRKWNVKKSA